MNLPGKGQTTDGPLSGPANSISTPRIDLSFNALGMYGSDQGIGFTEGARCRLYDEHQAFTYNSPGNPTRIIYHAPPNSCDPINLTDPSQCGACSFGYNNGSGYLCLNSECVGVHASKSVSSASATTGGATASEMYGAAQANLYYGNQGTDGTLVACNDQNVLYEYNWFVSDIDGDGYTNDVTTASQSWVCTYGDTSIDEKDSEGPIQDWFARVYQTTVVQGAGNQRDPDNHVLGHACPFIHNAICVGGYDPSSPDHVWPSSSNDNPDDPNILGDGVTHHDREEPDVLALGAGVQDLAITASEYPQANLWTTNDGTSQSAPTVAALVALLKQACAPVPAPRHPNMRETAVRAIVKTGAYLIDPTLGYHTTPPECPKGTACDGDSGAGLVNGDGVLDFCGYNRTGNTTGSYHGNAIPGSRSIQPTPPLPSGKYGGIPNGTLVDMGTLNAGETIRATLSWDVCVLNHDSAGETMLDFDLYLYNQTTQTFDSTWSATYDDNNEGFQIPITSTGDYRLFVAIPPSGGGNYCPGYRTEPYDLKWVHGTHF